MGKIMTTTEARKRKMDSANCVSHIESLRAKRQRDKLYQKQRWEAICMWCGSEQKAFEFFSMKPEKEMVTPWILDLMEFAIASRETRQQSYTEFRRYLRRLDAIQINVETPNLNNREKKLKEIFGKASRGIPYSELVEEFGKQLVDSTCELFNLAKG